MHQCSIQFTRALWSSNKTTELEYSFIKVSKIHIKRTKKLFSGCQGAKLLYPTGQEQKHYFFDLNNIIIIIIIIIVIIIIITIITITKIFNVAYKTMYKLKSFTKYLELTVFFMWNSALQEKFNFCFWRGFS